MQHPNRLAVILVGMTAGFFSGLLGIGGGIDVVDAAPRALLADQLGLVETVGRFRQSVVVAVPTVPIDPSDSRCPPLRFTIGLSQRSLPDEGQADGSLHFRIPTVRACNSPYPARTRQADPGNRA